MVMISAQKIAFVTALESPPAARVCPFLQPCILASEKNFGAWVGAVALHAAIILLGLLVWQELRPPQLMSNPTIAVPVMFTAPTTNTDNMTDQRVAAAVAPRPIAPPLPKTKTVPNVQPILTSPDSVSVPTNTLLPTPQISAAAQMAGSSGEFRGLPLDSAADYATAPVPPVYPNASIMNDEQGRSIIRARIDTDGAVAEVIVWQSSGFTRLDRAALTAVREWRFTPARQGFTPRAAWVDVPVDFVLR